MLGDERKLLKYFCVGARALNWAFLPFHGELRAAIYAGCSSIGAVTEVLYAAFAPHFIIHQSPLLKGLALIYSNTNKSALLLIPPNISGSWAATAANDLLSSNL